MTFAILLAVVLLHSSVPWAFASACPSGFAPCGDDNCCNSSPQAVCGGDTRGDQRCNHDATHRVCAKIGDPDTSFWRFTGQKKWCGQSLHYSNSPHGDDLACPPSKPTWCICKWATASWIKGEKCTDGVEIDCGATDICRTTQGLFFSYSDFSVDLKPAHDCMPHKCPSEWAACQNANSPASMQANSVSNVQSQQGE